ncbi:MAG: helix-turn-helix domain-containing protein [Blautia sp.]|nr:helix-turn-helix domain-containing protein [Blautia sp.]
MFKENELRAEMARSGVSVNELASALDINPATLYRKISNDGSFTREEIGKIIDFLKLDKPAIENIFFAH